MSLQLLFIKLVSQLVSPLLTNLSPLLSYYMLNWQADVEAELK